MTKARARERAKAKKNSRKGEAAARPGPTIRPGQFDPGSGSIKGPITGPHRKTFGAARRGSARSR